MNLGIPPQTPTQPKPLAAGHAHGQATWDSYRAEAPELTARIAAAIAPQGEVEARVRAALPQAMAVYAFGSRVTGGANARSDLDLAVLVPGYADALQLWELASQLSDKVGCGVDLLDFRAASTVMQHQVLTRGRKLWSVEPATGVWEAAILSEYTALNEARAPLLADIATSGRIHAR